MYFYDRFNNDKTFRDIRAVSLCFSCVKAEEDTNETKRWNGLYSDVVGGKLSQRDLTTSFKILIPRYEKSDLSTFCDATSLGDSFEVQRFFEKLVGRFIFTATKLH